MTAPVPLPQPTVGAIPWYKSPQYIGLVTTFISAAIALSPKIGNLLGLTSPGAIESAVTTVFGFIAFLAPLIGAIVRSNSKLQPITLTQAAANVHPATVAAEAALVEPLVESPVPYVAVPTAATPAHAPLAAHPAAVAPGTLKDWGHST